LARRTLFLLKPRTRHGLIAASAVKTLDLKFRVSDAQLRRALLGSPPVMRRTDEAVAHLLERIRHEGEQRLPYFRELCATYLLEVLVSILRSDREVRDRTYTSDVPEDTLRDPIALRAVRYVHDHYAQPITLRLLARALGISERHLRAHVSQALGQAPLRYLAEYRIDRAKDLIAHGEFALKEIAARTGFKSIHHFTRTFAKLAGMPPGAWRRGYADGIRRDVYIDPKFVNDLSPIASSLAAAVSGDRSSLDKSVTALDKDRRRQPR
jgi:AraC-like DNA-binding protein